MISLCQVHYYIIERPQKIRAINIYKHLSKKIPEAPDCEVFFDVGVSGLTPIIDRPEGAKLMAKMMGDNGTKVLYVSKVDRLTKDSLYLEELYLELRNRGIALVVIDDGLDTRIPEKNIFETACPMDYAVPSKQ